MEKCHPWMDRCHPLRKKCHPWMSSMDGEMSSMDGEMSSMDGEVSSMDGEMPSMDVIHGWRNVIHRWKCHPWMPSMDDIHGWRRRMTDTDAAYESRVKPRSAFNLRCPESDKKLKLSIHYSGKNSTTVIYIFREFLRCSILSFLVGFLELHKDILKHSLLALC